MTDKAQLGEDDLLGWLLDRLTAHPAAYRLPEIDKAKDQLLAERARHRKMKEELQGLGDTYDGTYLVMPDYIAIEEE